MRSHRLLNKFECDVPFQFTKRNDCDFAFISRGSCAGEVLLPHELERISYDCNIIPIKGIKPFEVKADPFYTSVKQINKPDVIMWFHLMNSHAIINNSDE